MSRKRSVKESSSFTKFRLLMWKNFLQQWRHKIQTAVELMLPVATMALILILRSQIEPASRDLITFPPIPVHSLNYSTPILVRLNFTRLSVAYSPKNDLLEDLVRSAIVKLLARNVFDLITIIQDAFPDIPPIEIPPDININTTVIYEFVKRLITVNGYESSADLRGIYVEEAATREVLAAVQFEDQLKDTVAIPNNLSYSLRFPEKPRLNSFYSRGGRSWRTDILYPVFDLPGPRFPRSWEGGNDPGYVNEMFIALQYAISTELITRITGENAWQYDVHLQRYPHPPYIEDLVVEALQFLFPMFMLLSFSYTAVNIIRAVTVEKELQLKETMKIMGLSTWLHWTAWFWKQFLYLLFTSIFIVLILKINWFTNEEGFSNYSVFTNTPWTVLMFFIVLYLTCTIFFCFMISGFFSKGSTAALFGGVIWFLTYAPAVLLSMDLNITIGVQVFTCLSINTAMSYGFQLLLASDSTGGMQWGEFFTRNSAESSRFVFGHVVLMLVLDCVLYMLVALYLEQVLPGPFGAPKPWYFLFQKSFWCSTNKQDSNVEVIDHHLSDVVKEKDPIGHDVGVKMIDLSKVYDQNIAVNRLNLNIYDDQITVLLGHNGAGKSTTISMLTGNVEITSGSVIVAGYDMTQQTRQARAHIGLCPQHNVLFNELTVREHLEFFARLKGYTGKELEEEINSLIANLEMGEKRDYLAHGLSGGQKRRLCVGIALSGGARVVLLDEPTSGMDPASRRALWNLLQKQKKGRTMILTTHFMDEADFLGDRVAIMSSGTLQCVGSPYFLKRYYGVGYTLVVVKDEGFDYDRLTDLIKHYIPELSVSEDRGSEVTYNLLDDHSHKFEAMLIDLERNIETIKFKNYGLVSTTLEDVFMKVGSDIEINSDADDATTITTESYVEDAFVESSLEQLNRKHETATGIQLLTLHVLAIWLKLGLVWIRSWGLLLLQIAVPILLMNTTLGVMQYLINASPTVVSRPLTLAEGYVTTETLLHYNGTNETSLGAGAKVGYEQFFNETGNENMRLTDTIDKPVDEYYLERTEDPINMGLLRNRLLIGATLDDEAAVAWFSNFAYHDVATSLATLHTALVKAKDAAANIYVFNHPLEATYYDQSDMQMLLSMLAMQISSGIGSSMAIVSAVFIMFYIKERTTRAKLLQKASGVQPVVMWGAAWIFDWLWNNIICVSFVISCAAFQVIGLSSVQELGRMYLCLIVYGAAMLPLNYLFSHVFTGPAFGFVIMFFINTLFGMIGSQIVEALSSPFLDTKYVADVMDAVLQFYPIYGLISAIRSLIQVGLTRYTCLQACDLLASAPGANMTDCTMEFLCENVTPSCCIREDPYLEWEEPGVLRYLTMMIVSGVLFWLILMFIEYRIFQKIYTPTREPPPVDESSLDEDVRDEATHAERATGSAVGEHALVSHRLSKYYGKNLAVDQLSFTVNDAECFGLLGVNGAGKTSTFKMLMADESISSGNAFVSGHSVKTNVNKVYENIGYCPQFDAVFGELTGRETLRLFSLLRGARGPLAESKATVLAYSLGFTKHLDKRVDQYSGGNRRKLSTALALVGGARLVFVDEPTSGVDAAARRRVWRSLMAARRANRALLLTSHSMEECEALCTRLTIMVNGRFQCLGTPQHLKNKFSQGFTLTIKIKAKDDEEDSSLVQARVDAIKEYVQANYTDPKLMEEYQGLLTFYLPDRTMAWSKMFGVMERAKDQLDVENYNISQTTLEQIFLQFTKYQKDMENNDTHM